MVQAIVFLPLLGAILAGLIAIFGAHARNPSGDQVERSTERWIWRAAVRLGSSQPIARLP